MQQRKSNARQLPLQTRMRPLSDKKPYAKNSKGSSMSFSNGRSASVQLPPIFNDEKFKLISMPVQLRRRSTINSSKHRQTLQQHKPNMRMICSSNNSLRGSRCRSRMTQP